MKKILYIFNGIENIDNDPIISGGTIRLLEIIKGNSHFESDVLTNRDGDLLLDKQKIVVDNRHIIDFGISESITSNFVICLKSFFQLPKSLNKYKGIVYSSCEHLYDVLPALRLKFKNKCNWYATYHWVEDWPWKDKRGGTPMLRRYIYWFNRWLSGIIIKKYADRILAISQPTKEKLVKIKKIKPEKIKVVRCGVENKKITDFLRKHEDERGKEYDAVFMKRLNYGKGILDLLKIWKKVSQEKKDVRLAIIGDGTERVLSRIRGYIKKNNLEKNIHLLGGIYDFEKKFRVLNSAKVFLLPSHEENWAIVIGEAMAAKVPVLVYDLKEIVPIWKDNVEWVRYGDTDEFAKKILICLKDPQKRRKQAFKGFKFIKDYDWGKISKEEFK